MARAPILAEERHSLYERDFGLWLEQQAALLRAGRLDEVDVAGLVDAHAELLLDGLRGHAR